MNFAVKTDFVNEVNYILSLLSPKERDVITRRYGFGGNEPKTLAEIGAFYGISRERVRQIQQNCFKKLRRNYGLGNFKGMVNEFMVRLKNAGGILFEENAFAFISEKYPVCDQLQNELAFILEISEDIAHEHNKVDFRAHFRLAEITFPRLKELNNSAVRVLKECGDKVKMENLFKKLKVKYSYDALKSFLSVDKRIVEDTDSVSLAEWRHVNPKTLYDKISFVLNTKKEPLHFTKVAELILNYKFDDKPVSTHAVHNELINNPKFVLIGRGIYADKDWGYKEGTVTDVIASILEKKGPMHLYDITQEVLQRRKVKAVTVQINLNAGKSKFKKNKDGQYELV